MSFSFKGFGINLKPSFFIMSLCLVLIGRGRELCVLVFSVTLHEAAHVLAAYMFGVKAEGISITPIGEVATIHGLERISFFGRMVVVLSGPMVNLVLYLLFASKINLALFVLNLLPAYPLDGGRALHYVLGYCLGVLRANRVQSFLSLVIAVLLFGLGFVQLTLYGYNLSLFCIGLYLIKINRREYFNMTFAFYRSVMNRSDKKVLYLRGFTASGNMPVKAIVYRLGWDYYAIVYVRLADDVLYSVTEEELISYIMQNSLNHRLYEVVEQKLNSCVYPVDGVK